MTAASTYAARSRRRRAARALVIALVAIVAIPIGLFMLVAGMAGERR